MSLVKYRLRDVAADFGVAPKEVSEIVAKYYEKPKSNTQVLTEDELNAVFDHITKNNQISSLEQVFAVKPKEQPKAEQPKAEPVKAEAPKSSQSAKPAEKQSRPQQQNAPKAAEAPAKPKEPERKRERRVVDTSAVQVNANRFADVDNLVSERVQNYQGGKQRIGGGKGSKQQKQQ
ncbi:MAG: hypothetical protein ACI3W5_15130, partial [Faecousia sp.]